MDKVYGNEDRRESVSNLMCISKSLNKLILKIPADVLIKFWNSFRETAVTKSNWKNIHIIVISRIFYYDDVIVYFPLTFGLY